MNNVSLEKRYGLLTATCMVVGIVIGSGVFFKAQDILNYTGGNMLIGILAWLIGGAVMMLCAYTFGNFATRYVKVNGIVDYAEAIVGEKYAYMVGWFVSTIYFPAMTSVLAWVSARYTLALIYGEDSPVHFTSGLCIALGACYLCLAYAINMLSPKLAGKFQVSATVVKLIPLGIMVIVGTIVGLINGNTVHAFTDGSIAGSTGSSHSIFSGIAAAAFAYEGWIIATSINSEIKDSKKNLPKALILGGFIIMATYILYYIGVAGGATNQELIDKGATYAYTNIFGNVLGNVLNLFIAISCLGTTNGLMLGCTRCLYALADRGEGPNPKMFDQVDKTTNMPANSAVFALFITAAWFLYFYLSNLAATWSGPFVFDSTELPIITIYLMYLPILIQWMRKEKDQNTLRRFVLPILALCGSVFMVIASIFSHRMGCVWYLIVFAVMMVIGGLVDKSRKNK